MTQRPLVMAPPDAPLIIGEAPARDTEDLPAFCGRSGSRLSSLLRADVLSVARTMNLLRDYPGRQGCSGAAFPMAVARERAARIGSFRHPKATVQTCGFLRHGTGHCTICHPATVLLAGKRVAEAFRVGRQPYFQWFHMLDARVAVIPHPSGASRFWNVPSNVVYAARFLRAVFEEES